MKRLIAFIFVVVLIIFVGYYNDSEESMFDLCDGILIITSKPVENKKFYSSGGDFYSTFDVEESQSILKNLNRINGLKGVNLYFDGKIPFSYFSDKITYLKQTKDVGEYKVFEGYTTFFDKFNWIDNKKINVQLVQTQDQWILGVPLILTGF